jgi:hypothetical protein
MTETKSNQAIVSFKIANECLREWRRRAYITADSQRRQLRGDMVRMYGLAVVEKVESRLGV